MLTKRAKIGDRILNGMSLSLLLIIYIWGNSGLNKTEVIVIFTILIYPISSLFFIFQDKNFHGNWFSINKLFAIGYIIVFFQVPLDFMVGSDLDFQSLFFDINKAGKSFSFSALCFVLYILGVKSYSPHSVIHDFKPRYIIPSSPNYFLLISLIFLSVFFITV